MSDDDDAGSGELLPAEPERLARTSPPNTSPAGIGSVSVNIGISASYISQLPPAAEIAKLEAILPGTLDRLLRLQEGVAQQAVVEQTHRHKLENSDDQRKTLGQKIAVGAFLIAMAVTLILALTGHSAVAEVVGGATVVGVVGIFVTGRVFHQGEEEDHERTEEP